jgi:large subunit ribosomal protein L10
MKLGLILAATLAGSSYAFSPKYLRPGSITSSTALDMGGCSKFATSKEGKAERVDSVKQLLEKTQMIISVPADKLTVKQVSQLRRSLPTGTTAQVVKNTLMARACEGTSFEKATSDTLQGSNMWFFIEEDIGGTVKAFNQFVKENNKKDYHTIRAGVIEGIAYDSAGVDAISKLPSKLELIARIAGGIKAVPTKLARVVKAPGNKLARAIKLATDKNNGVEPEA